MHRVTFVPTSPLVAAADAHGRGEKRSGRCDPRTSKNPQPEPGVLARHVASVADQLMVIGIVALTVVLVLT